ncbi:MAG: menaquinone biosynthesis protein [Lentisphaeraceae bacterium]|nr:menaquinone biosynthesis protein [Lentisphaeraceae bacterium]
MLKIGFISYLNAYPYFFPFQNLTDEEKQGWELIVDRPGELNRMVREGELDVSFVSFMEYATNPDKYLMVPGIGLSSKGYVDSVKLLSQVPMEELNNSDIQVTSASATSVAVMEILLHEVGVTSYDCVQYDVKKGIPESKAALTIGDEALTEKSDYKYTYDLGEMWQQKFSRNIVFASCIINRDAVEWKQSELNSLIHFLQQAPEKSYEDWTKLESACLAQYPQIKEPMQYLDRLQFTMSETELSDLDFFLKKAYECGLLPQRVIPKYFEALAELAQKGEVH